MIIKRSWVIVCGVGGGLEGRFVFKILLSE